MKQYALVCNEEAKAHLEKVIGGGLEYLEIQGMNIQGNDGYKLLVVPVVPPVPMAPPTVPPACDAPPEEPAPEAPSA